jgi:hypothetical protein
MECACTEREGVITGLCMAHHWAFCANLVVELGDLHALLKKMDGPAMTEKELDAAAAGIRQWLKIWTPGQVGDGHKLMWHPPPEAEAL